MQSLKAWTLLKLFRVLTEIVRKSRRQGEMFRDYPTLLSECFPPSRLSRSFPRNDTEPQAPAPYIEYVSKEREYKMLQLKLFKDLNRAENTVLAVTAGSSPHFVYREDWRERSCARVLHKVRHQLISSSLPPDITGDWVSYRCEIRSGPEYVIRHFSFHNNTFEAIVYRYQDPDCHVPAYTIESRGTHKLRQPSWTVRGATEAEYQVTSAHIVTYSKNVSSALEGILAAQCLNIDPFHRLTPYSRYLVYSSAASHSLHQDTVQQEQAVKHNMDCFSALNFSLHELQLAMVELRRHHHHHHHHYQHHHRILEDESQQSLSEGRQARELLLGAVHSRPQERQTHRPSSFQTALKEAHTPGCGVCSRVVSASPMYPPRLTSHSGTLLSLEGEWVSTRCESRQYGMFLTRWLHFLSDGSSWQGQYDYYHDALCRLPSFSLYAKGSYSGGTDSQLVPGAKDYSFKVMRLKVTPHDQATVDSMNHYDGNGCGKAHAWAVNQEQDVTWTGGCVTLGIRLPNMERDIMKMEIARQKLHLYVGQRLLDKKPGTSYQKERPTAFQEPLVKCDQVDLDMSINTAPGGHGWAGAVALPLSAGPDDFILPASGGSSRFRLELFTVWLVVMVTMIPYQETVCLTLEAVQSG